MFTGGGTGGHVYPALAVADALLRLEPTAVVRFVGGRRGIEGRLVPAHGHRLVRLPAAGLRGRGVFGALGFAWRFLLAALMSLAMLIVWRPKVVLATGGYACAAPSVVAALIGIPVWLQEQNSAPGSTNRVLARFAERAYVAFDAARVALARSKQVIDMPNPVRHQLVQSADQAPAAADYESFGLQPDRPTLLVFGGSRGATTLSRAVVEAWPRIERETAWQVLLQTSQEDLESTRAALSREPGATLRARVLPYIDDMAAAYRVADLVVCRAGALTLAELATVGKPALLVPFPHATDDHQRRNARALADVGAARWVDDADFDGARLVDEVGALMDDPAALRAMHAAVRSWGGGRDAAHEIARDLLTRAKEQR